MQSLTALNTYSSTPVSFVDLRPPEIQFDRQVPTNQTTAQYESRTFSFNITPGINITLLAGATASYSIDLANNSTCSVSWGVLPSHLTATQDGQKFTVSGLTTVGDWNTVRSPLITGTMGVDPFTITSTIRFETSVVTWTTANSVISLNELSIATGDAFYTSGVSSLIAHTPLVVDNVPGMDTNSYTLTISVDDNSIFGSMSSAGILGGTSTFIDGIKLVITGSMDQINSHLQSLHFTSRVDLNQVFLLTYSLYNDVSSYTSVKTQYASANTMQYFSYPSATYYNRNYQAHIDNFPQILSTVTTPGEYFIDITPSVGVFSISSSGEGGSAYSYGSGWRIIGTKEQLNSHLANLYFQAALNYNSNFVFRYTLHTPDSVIASIPQSILIGDANSTVLFDELTAPASPNIYYAASISASIVGAPTVTPTTTQPFVVSSYTLTITPSRLDAITVMSSAGTGGTSTFNSTTKVLTITGTATQINSHLAALSYTSDAVNNPFTITYALLNSSEPFYSYEYQTASDATSTLWTSPTTFVYDKNVSTTITSNPTIISGEHTTPGDLTCLVYPTDLSAITTLSGTGATTSFDDARKTLTITGNITQMNSCLSSLVMQPGLDFASSFGLKYQVTATNGMIGQVVQTMNIGVVDTAITNISVGRSFLSNTPDQLVFTAPIPQILETLGSVSYTIYMSTDSGYFGLNDSSLTTNYTYTGTKDQVNAILPTIKFYPLKDIVGNRSFTYQQVRDGLTQVTQNISYVGTARTTELPEIEHIFNNNTVYTPTFSEKTYYKATYLIVGGGGGGGWYDKSGFGVPSTYFLGGGGGGGTVYIQTAPRNVTGNITVVIGSGGAASIPTGGNGGDTSITLAGYSTVTVDGGYGGVAGGGTTTKAFTNSSTFWAGGTWGNWAGGGGASSTANGGAGSGSQGGTGPTGTLYRGFYFGGGGGGGGGDSTNGYQGGITGIRNGGAPILYSSPAGSGFSTGCGGLGSYYGRAGQKGLCIVVFSPF